MFLVKDLKHKLVLSKLKSYKNYLSNFKQCKKFKLKLNNQNLRNMLQCKKIILFKSVFVKFTKKKLFYMIINSIKNNLQRLIFQIMKFSLREE